MRVPRCDRERDARKAALIAAIFLAACATQLLPEPVDASPPPDLAGLSCSQFLACAERCVAFDECLSACSQRVRAESQAQANGIFLCMDNECTNFSGAFDTDCDSPRGPMCDTCVKDHCPSVYAACKAD